MNRQANLPLTCALSLVLSFCALLLPAEVEAPPKPAAAPAITSDERPAVNLYRLTVTELYDGDTLTADLDLDYDVTLRNQRIRAAGYDAQEITRHRRAVHVTDDEIAKGKEAASALAELLQDGEPYLAPPPPGTAGDPYGRRGGRLYVVRNGRWTSVAAWMRNRGYHRGPE